MTEPLFKAALIELSNDAYFIELCCMKEKESIDTVQSALRTFYLNKCQTGEHERDYSNKLDVRRNFCFWLPSHLRRERDKIVSTQSKTEKTLSAAENAKRILNGEQLSN